MPTVTMNNTLYQELEQAAKMTGWTTTAVLEAAAILPNYGKMLKMPSAPKKHGMIL